MKTIAKWMRWRTKHSVMLREDTTRNAQPLDLAWTIRTDRIRVPAPRLELQSGSLNEVRSILYELAKNAELEICE